MVVPVGARPAGTAVMYVQEPIERASQRRCYYFFFSWWMTCVVVCV